MKELPGIVFLLGYILFLGLGTFLQKLSLRELSPYQLNFLIAIGMGTVSVVALLLVQKSLAVPLKYIPIGGAVGLLFAIGSLFFTLSLTKFPAGIASGISVSYVVIVALLSSIFLKEPMSLIKIVGILMTVIGVGILFLHDASS